MSTTSATEAARQRDGQFGTQVRTELDPANAGLDVPEAPLPTWEDALTHAKMLRERGVDVGIDERYRVIEIRDDNGRLHDPADGAPAFQCFYSDGTPMWIAHYTNGNRDGYEITRNRARAYASCRSWRHDGDFDFAEIDLLAGEVV